MRRFRPISRLSRLTVLLTLVLGVLALGHLATAMDAQAQSSVRPPAGATVNVAPNPGISRGDVPARAAQPTNVKEGRVPGRALGNKSDAEMWRAVRRGVQGTVSIPDKKAAQLVQSEGDNWRAVRNGPLSAWGVMGLAAILLVLVLFMLGRGRVTIESGRSGETVTRFNDVERMAHWLLAVSFIILALTGLNFTYGKYTLMPLLEFVLSPELGKSVFATLSQWGKWLHNYVAFAFMVGLVMIFVLWVKDNFLNKYDLIWISKAGGLFTTGSHPPSKKFNAGQKLIFWLVVVGGIGLSLTGLSMLFPHEIPLFTQIFAALNAVGFDLPTTLTPLEEMQYATTWHAILAIVMMMVIIGHIYIGSIGMEGAFDAMGSGEVDVNWAKEHHSVWVDETIAASEAAAKASAKPKAAPAE